jgi:hypothetical protein
LKQRRLQMATRKEMNRTSGVARQKAPLDKYKNITNAGTVRGLMRSGGPITGSASGVRSISSKDAFNTLGQFFVGEALGVGLAAGAAKLVGSIVPKVSKGIRGTRVAAGPNAFKSGARPMTTAERSVAVTRAGKTGYGPGYIGKGVNNMYDDTYGSGLPYKGDIWDEVVTSRYSEVYGAGLKALEKKRRGTGPADYVRVTGNQAKTIYKGHTTPMHVHGGSTVPVIPKYMQDTLLNRLGRLNRLKRRAGK